MELASDHSRGWGRRPPAKAANGVATGSCSVCASICEPFRGEICKLQLLNVVARLGWHIIVHPNVIHTPDRWMALGDRLCIENMDKRKPIGQTARDLSKIFEQFPRASFCFDLGHARQVDPTMSEAIAMLHQCADRLAQLHISEVNTQSKHDPLTFEAVLAFHRLAQLLPEEVPIILESRVPENRIEAELDCALRALDPEQILAFAGD